MKEPKQKTLQKDEGFAQILLNLLRSVKLTIGLLILLATVSIFGTFIKQNAPRSEYIERYGVDLYRLFDFFNLFDMYHSWWFSAILFLLVMNLIACTSRRIQADKTPILGGPKKTVLEEAMIKTLPYVERIRTSAPSTREAEIQSCLKKWLGDPDRIETESSITLYSEKGRFSRLGFLITHLSILIILIGGLIGSLYGFRGFVNILEGETVDHIFLRVKDDQIPRPLGFKVRCDEFSLTFYDLPGREEKHVKEYTSVLTIVDNGKEILNQKVRVNHPLHYKGLVFYQSSYGTIHHVSLGIQARGKKEKMRLDLMEGETAFIPNSNTQIRLLRYVPQIHSFGEGAQVLLFKPNQPPQSAWVLKGFPDFDQQRRDDFVLTMEGVTLRDYTGLQVTKDPGVWVVWVGCGLMILGLILSFFFSHQRVWVKIPKDPRGEIILAGTTNKNRVSFERSFGQWVREVRNRAEFQ